MKKLTLILLAAVALFAGQNKVSAQGKYGADSAECLKYLSYYQEYFKQKNYDSALPNWRKAYSICPATASQNMFIHGTRLMTRQLDKIKDPSMRSAIIDTIITLQDQRMATYPKKRQEILNNKGQYMINYRGSDSKYIYENLSVIVDELGSKASGSVLVNLLQSGIALYRENQLTADDVIALYDKVSEAIGGAQVKSDAEAEDNAKAKATIESIFADSKVASCDNLIAIFGPRYAADPDNLALVSNIVRLMNNAEDCASNDLYLNAVTSMYKLDPSYRSAYALFRLNSARGNIADAGKYLEQAIASPDSDPATDAQYYYELALFAYKNGLRSKAADAARKAVDLDFGFAGKAYMILGNLWASATCTDDVDKYARFWAATDYFQKARTADPTLAEDAASSIAGVARYYPEASEIFMYDLTKNQSYTVSCGGLSATTTVRVK
ncbi:MAG: tetratricopeptide repeat protein [Bacteroidales bacterium]|nr:tetratricopeptide repeat protein [Bacteroidales bacterium]